VELWASLSFSLSEQGGAINHQHLIKNRNYLIYAETIA